MKYNKDIIDRLKTQIKNQVNEYEYNSEIINKLYNSFKTNDRLKECGSIIKISDNKIIIEYMCSKEINRTKAILRLIENSIEYIKKKKMNFPDTKLFLFVSDIYAYFDQELPLFVLAKPKNKKGILIPDNTFDSHPNVSRVNEDWETTKEKCIDNIVPYDKKKDVLFFIGGNTDVNRQNIRSNLKKLSDGESVNGITVSKNKLPLQIEFQHNRDLSEFSQFKYLLNLPGNQPWSYRFKYLFLSKSLVVNVDVRQRFKDSEYVNDTWINFFDTIFEPNLDYINLVYHWFDFNEEFNKLEFEKLIDNLELTYKFYDSNPSQYKSMAESGFNKVSYITEDLINESIFLLAHYYAKKINPFL